MLFRSLCDALYKSTKLKYISCHHEQAVSFATESFSRVKNNPGAAIITTGPGGTNCTTGVASCWIDSVPAIFISGQVYLNQTIGNSGSRQKGVQEFDIISMVKSSTKYAVMVKDPNLIKYHLEKAYYEAITGRPGPVWLDIPANIQSKHIRTTDLTQMLIQLVASGRGIAALPDWVVNEYEQKGWVVSRRLDCVSPQGLRRTLYAGYRTEDKEKNYFEGFLKQLEKFSKKRAMYYED